jgi:hypothetical protein
VNSVWAKSYWAGRFEEGWWEDEGSDCIVCAGCDERGAIWRPGG